MTWDANGILNVSAKDKATNKEQSIVIKASSGLSEEEIAKMVQDAESHAEEDRQFEELVSVRNVAEGVMHATRKSLEEAGDKIEDSEKSAIEGAITALEEAIKTDDKDDIQAKAQALTEASAPLMEKMYAQANVDAAGDTEASSEAPDAVDAEFEEIKDEDK